MSECEDYAPLSLKGAKSTHPPPGRFHIFSCDNGHRDIHQYFIDVDFDLPLIALHYFPFSADPVQTYNILYVL